MEEIDEMLNRWIYNSIIRKQLRDLIKNYVHQTKYGYNLKNKK
jgi:hypothetical protein